MIKLKQVKTELGKAVLVFDIDLNDSVQTVEVDEEEIIERLKQVKKLLGRQLTIQDLKDVVKAIINEFREGKSPLAEKFDYSQFIEVDIEQ